MTVGNESETKIKRKKICLIYTGGTIGMIEEQDENGEWVRRPPKDVAAFEQMAPEINTIADIEFVPLLNKDSTDMNPNDWTAMAKAVYERRTQFDGFVIAHGTDTMHFSASALAFAFGRNLNFPIVFTGAQTTAFVAHGDARINLIRAVRVAIEDIAEVVICFGNYVFRGCRTQKKDERLFDAFHSPAFFPLADITETIQFTPSARRIDPERGEIDFQPDFELGLLQISLIPGLLPKNFDSLLDNNAVGGVILQSFGAGNVPMEAEFSFEGFIQKAKNKNIPVIIASQFPANSTLHSIYEPGQKAIKAGAIPTGNMTNAAASAKFRWVLAGVNQEIKSGKMTEGEKLAKIKQRMTKTIVEEMDDNTSQSRSIDEHV
ncbi:MAG: asparaginase [Pseudomonadota bacterium]